jgi:uncharacterized protein YfaS (alpha-2-macroglobulin family)
MSDKIDVGEIVRITNGDGFKTKPAEELFDPVDVELTVRSPSGDVTDLTADVIQDSEGLYHADLTVDETGVWWFRWDGDAVIEEGAFIVRPRRVSEAES